MPTKTLMTAAEYAKTGPETDGFEFWCEENCNPWPNLLKDTALCA